MCDSSINTEANHNVTLHDTPNVKDDEFDIILLDRLTFDLIRHCFGFCDIDSVKTFIAATQWYKQLQNSSNGFSECCAICLTDSLISVTSVTSVTSATNVTLDPLGIVFENHLN